MSSKPNQGLSKRTKVLIFLFGLFAWSIFGLLKAISSSNTILIYCGIVACVVFFVFFMLVFLSKKKA